MILEGRDFMGFIVLKSPEICFSHLSGNPVLFAHRQSHMGFLLVQNVVTTCRQTVALSLQPTGDHYAIKSSATGQPTQPFILSGSISEEQCYHQMSSTLLWWRHLVSACEVRAQLIGLLAALGAVVSGSLPSLG